MRKLSLAVLLLLCSPVVAQSGKPISVQGMDSRKNHEQSSISREEPLSTNPPPSQTPSTNPLPVPQLPRQPKPPQFSDRMWSVMTDEQRDHTLEVLKRSEEEARSIEKYRSASGLPPKADESKAILREIGDRSLLRAWKFGQPKPNPRTLFPNGDKAYVVDVKDCGPPPKQSDSGSVSIVINFMHENLNDPTSFEIVEWSPVIATTRNQRPCWAVRLKYRARNAFNALMLHEDEFYIRDGKVIGREQL